MDYQPVLLMIIVYFPINIEEKSRSLVITAFDAVIIIKKNSNLQGKSLKKKQMWRRPTACIVINSL